ncbi:hypothetical protein BOTBODRAFT_473798 [Botryobasidium botryosum FD-172 SS1]|uniref:Uncharacterized protein n=1 Tax=Botryobasidium botryosum (strain FD-172 SS1) TaxID=930990 RepID=A0A067M5H5_BOTB1|nr:hypothetical protein BOTBODRAFT_473798 [Botryobasidium botryosum FD-172 SS1]
MPPKVEAVVNERLSIDVKPEMCLTPVSSGPRACIGPRVQVDSASRSDLVRTSTEKNLCLAQQ